MTMTDPIADMLTRLRNANAAYQDSVSMPYSKIKVHLAEILQQEGYIGGFEVRDAEVGKNLVVSLTGRAVLEKDNLPRVLGGLGIAIISTSGGLMTDKQAVRRGVGGEVLAFVWRGELRCH